MTKDDCLVLAVAGLALAAVLIALRAEMQAFLLAVECDGLRKDARALRRALMWAVATEGATDATPRDPQFEAT
jgi:hypothetical protein